MSPDTTLIFFNGYKFGRVCVGGRSKRRTRPQAFPQDAIYGIPTLLLGQKPLYSNDPINYNGLILRVCCRESRFTVKLVL